MSKKKLFLMISTVLLSVLIVATCVTTIVCAVNGKFHFSDYAYDSQSVVNLQDYDTDIETVDGNLNDSIWENKNWLTYNTQEMANQATMKFTTYLGSKGIYIAVDVKDNDVFYAKSKGQSYNTGIEMYIAPYGSTTCEKEAYQVTMDASGDYVISRYKNGGYSNYPSQLLLATHIDGELNSADCEGYQLEAFIPYESIGLNGAVDKINIDTALIRTTSNETIGSGATNERTWNNFGQIYHADYFWNNPSTWYSFDSNGLIANKININSNAGGTIESVTKNVIAGDSYVLSAKADSGKVLDSIKVNGEDLTYKLKQSSNGDMQLTLLAVSGDLTVDAEFADLPSDTHTVSGKITVPSGLNISDTEMYLQKGTFKQTVTLDSNGGFTADFPAMKDVYLVTKLNGCDTDMRKLDLSAANKTNVTVGLNSASLGALDNYIKKGEFDLDYVDLNEVSVTSDDATDGKADIYLKNETQACQVVEADLAFPNEGRKDLRQGFVFKQEIDGSVHSVFVSLYWNGSDSSFKIQKVCDPGTGKLTWEDIALESSYYDLVEKLQSGKSVRFTVVNNAGQFGVFLDGELVGSFDKTSVLSSSQPTVVGLEAWSMKTTFKNLSCVTGADAVNKVYNEYQPFTDVMGMDVSKATSQKKIIVTGESNITNEATYYKELDDFVFETTMKHTNTGTDSRQGVIVKFANKNGTYDFYEISFLVGEKNNTDNVRFQLYGAGDGNGHNLVPSNMYWFSINLPENLKEEYLSDKGIDVKVIREGNKIMTAVDGKIIRTDEYNSIAGRKAKVGIVSYINGAVYPYNFSSVSKLNIKIAGTENGSVSCSGTNYSYGDTFTLNVAPDSGYKLQSLLIDGVDRVNDVVNGQLTISDYAGSPNMVIQPTFGEIVYVQLPFCVTKTANGVTTDASGAKVSFKYADGTVVSGDVSGNSSTLMLEQNSTGTLTVTLDGYDTAVIQMTVPADAAQQNIDLQKTVLINKYGFDLSQQGYGKATPVADFANAVYAGLSDKTVYCVRATFSDTQNVKKREGFVFALGKEQFSITINYDSTRGYEIQSLDGIAAWTSWYNFNADNAMIAKYQSSAGLTMTVVRNGSHYDIFLDSTLVASADIDAKYATATGDVILSTFDGIKDTIIVPEPTPALPTMQVSNDVTGNGSVTFNKEAYTYGDNVSITATPDDGYYLKSLLVNGVDKTSQCIANVCNLTAFRGLGVNAVAVFDKLETVSVAVKTATDGVTADSANAAVKFKSSSGSIVNAVYSDGVYTLKVMLGATGTLSVSQDGYDTIENPLTVTADMALQNIELQKTILISNNGFDLSQQGYGKVTPVATYSNAVFAGLSDKTKYVVSATFSDTQNTQKRQGFVFALGSGKQFSMTFNYDGTRGYEIQSLDGVNYSWNSWFNFNGDSALIAKYKSTGLTMTIVRDGSRYDLYIEGTLVASADLGSQYASATGDVMLYTFDGIKDTIIVTEPTLSLPTLKVLGQVTGSGSVTYDKGTYTYGDNVIITANPQNGYYLKTLLVNGVDKTSECVANAYTLTAFRGFEVNVVAIFDNTVTVSVPVKTVMDGITADSANATVKFTSADGSIVNATYSDGVYKLDVLLGTTGTLTISQDGYDTIAKSLTATANIAPQNIELQKTILTAVALTYWSGGFDLSQQGYNKMTPVKDSGIATAVYAGLSDKTEYTVSATFSDTKNTQKRQGFVFVLGTGKQFSMTINYDATRGYEIQSLDGVNYSWNSWYNFNSDAAMIAKYKSSGITLKVARSGAHYDVYLDDVLIASTDLDAQYATATGDVEIAAFEGIKDTIIVTEPSLSFSTLDVFSEEMPASDNVTLASLFVSGIKNFCNFLGLTF